jgi:hypothetical protein
MSADLNQYPAGWDAKRIAGVLQHYEGQSEDDAAAEDDAAVVDPTHTIMEIPTDLVPAVRELIAKRRPA